MLELRNSKTIGLGRNRYAIDAFIGAVRMSDDGVVWQDIKPRLVRDTDGWHVEGTPYYAELKDDGTRLFCPDRNERSRYLKLPTSSLLAPLDKNVQSNPAKLDGQLLPNQIVMPYAEWADIIIGFTNTGMTFSMLFKEVPPEQFEEKFIFNAETAGLDIKKMLSEKSGLGVPRPRLVDNEEDTRWLDWSNKDGELELGFGLSGLVFPVLLKNVTIDQQVEASSDDCYVRRSDGGFTLTNGGFPCGDYNSSLYDYEAGARFQTVNVPQGATIDVSYLQLYGYEDYGANPTTLIYGEDIDDAPTFSDYNDYIARKRTSSYTSWTPPDWVNPGWNTSDSINSVIQENVDRGGWAANNNIVLFWQHSLGYIGSQQYISARSWDYNDHSYAPKLHIEYTAGGSSSTNRGWWSK